MLIEKVVVVVVVVVGGINDMIITVFIIHIVCVY